MTPLVRLQLRLFATAIALIVVVLVVWRFVPGLKAWSGPDAPVVGLLFGMLFAGTSQACRLGQSTCQSD